DGLVGQRDPGSLAEPELVGRRLDAVAEAAALRPEGVAQRIEVDVARHRQRVGEVDGTVRTAAGILEDPIADPQASVVDDRRGRRDQPALEGGDGGEQLEGRAWRVLALDRSIGERVVPVRVLERPEERW